MTKKTYIHGGTDEREVARLEKQARFAWKFIGPKLEIGPGARVLDLATGVGAMANQLRLHLPGIRLMGVDLNRAQLDSARRNHPEIPYVNADGAALPFRDGTFDHVHCSWLLEHVTEPVRILREVHRVLRPGGTAWFVEVDNATFRTEPRDEEIAAVMDVMNETQARGGGDPYVGRKLGQLFLEAGFQHVELDRMPLHGTHDDPDNFREIVEEFAEIFESVDEALEPEMAARARKAADALRALLHRPGTSMYYASVFARAVR